MTDLKPLTFWSVALRTIVVHTVTYFAVGLLAALTVYWVRHAYLRWLNWGLALLFVVVLALPVLGLVAGQAPAP
jgi:hypothetical protein